MELVVLLCACGIAAALPPITVVQLRLAYNEVHVLQLNSTIEYILEFTLPGYDLSVPNNVWVRSEGGDIAHPVLVTARQRSGAVTWQLPYEVEDRRLFELERTLCPDNTAVTDADSNCADDPTASERVFSLHVSSACVSPVRVSVRVLSPPAWRLQLHQPVTLSATLSSPRVLYYEFEETQSSVRLVLASDADVCATISVQDYQCPIAQTMTEVSLMGMRMTMLRSGGVQLSRKNFPRGFYVVSLVRSSENPCGGDEEVGSEWLWEEVFKGRQIEQQNDQRRKDLTISVEPALTRTQYVVGSIVTLALFLGFYLLFGALVLAQRWPTFARYVSPLAVLAEPSPDTSVVEQGRENRVNGRPDGPTERRRRGSDATFDSSDASDSDEEDVNNSIASRDAGGVVRGGSVRSGPERNGIERSGPERNGTDRSGTERSGPERSPSTDAITTDGTDGAQATQTNPTEEQGPFGLPARLHLAALARRGGRTLRARSDRYLYMLYTVAIFYALPVTQFVLAFQIILNVSGSLDICYYNFLCAHRAGTLSDFNHVVSNVGYLLLGALFMIQVRRRRLRRKRQPRNQEYGIPAHYGLLSALGAGMMVVALLSASYHVCPNRLNFQFDTAFMYVLAVLMMVKIYQSRHPDVNARAHATFGVLAVLIALVLWGVLGGGPVFWGVFTVMHIFTFLLLSLRIYYVGQFRLEKKSLTTAASELRRPRYGARLLMLIIANVLNWMLALFGLLKRSSDFAGHMLQVLLGNALVHMCCYLGMKLVHGERLRWYAWVLLAGAAAAWAPALYFFLSGSTDWSTAPALSRHRNHECVVLQFYDAHDLWHMLSAVALYLTFSVLLTWDDGLSAVKRTEIPVF